MSAVVVHAGQRAGSGPRPAEGPVAPAACGGDRWLEPRAVADVAAEHGVSWHTAHNALVAAAARWLPEPAPTRVLGIDETRTRTVRWILEEVGAQRVWRRSDPWMTSFVDADSSPAGVLLGLAPGRSGSCVRAWLGEQTPAFRDAVELVVIDPSAPYACGIRAALPQARIAVDKWHLVRLANDMVTEGSPAGDPRAARPPGHTRAAGVGASADAAARRRPALGAAAGEAARRAGQRRPDR